MSETTSVDRNPAHLYPEFRKKVYWVLAKLEEATGEPWMIAEGYRSVERQLWLYGQGRPGATPYGRAGTVVTWKRTPTWHGTGIAVDLMPKRGYKGVPQTHWNKLRALGQEVGLDNPAWVKGDFGHLQWSNLEVRRRALAWIAAGRPERADPWPVRPVPEVVAVVDGDVVEDAGAYIDPMVNRALVRLRPVARALGWDVIRFEKEQPGQPGGVCTLVLDTDTPEEEGREVAVPVVLQKRADDAHAVSYVLAATLAKLLGVKTDFKSDADRKTVSFASPAPASRG